MSWYEEAAKKGFLGNKAKMAADTKRADWSETKMTGKVDKARDHAVKTVMKPKVQG